MARLALLISFLLVSPLYGQLHWETLEQEQKAKPGDQEATAKFHFINAGKSAIKIINVGTSCECTTAGLAQDEFAPGEAGEIEARFEFGSYVGRQQKMIAVTTSDAPGKPTLLRLIVDIPQAMTLEPEFLFWKAGEPITPKKFRAAIGEGFPAKLLGVESDNPDVHFVINVLQPQKEIEVIVTPDESKRPQQAMLSVKTDSPAENPLIRYVYIRVK